MTLEVKRLDVRASGLKLPFYSDETQADVVLVVGGGEDKERKKEKGVSVQN